MMYSAIILCAGSGKRTGLGYNKMFYQLQGETVYEKTVNVFLHDKRCEEIIIVCKKEEQSHFKKLLNKKCMKFVEGGKERQDSVYEGLKHVTSDYVMIHDGARPFVKKEKKIWDFYQNHGNKEPAAPPAPTKRKKKAPRRD